MITSFLNSGNWVFAHKFLIRELSSDAALIIGLFSSIQTPGKNKGWFYCTHSRIEDEIGIKVKAARTSIHLLLRSKFIIAKRQGIPCKTWYKLEEDNLLEFFKATKIKSYPKGEDKTYPKGEDLYRKNLDSKNKKSIINNTQKRFPKFYKQFDFFQKDFKRLWFNEFIPLKNRKKASISPEQLEKQLDKIKTYSNNNYDTALEILEKSINSGWADFFPIKNNYKKSTNSLGSRNGNTRTETYREGTRITDETWQNE